MTDELSEARRPTLLAKLAPLFGAQTENLAVEALGHILSGSEALREVLATVVRAGGADVGPIARVATQAALDGGERPDLVGFDADGTGRVLVEAKFWAGLTDNQPVGYLDRLGNACGSGPSALLFVAPEARMESLWSELRRLIEASKCGLRFDQSKRKSAIRSADVGADRWLMLVSWKYLLGGMEVQAGDAHTKMDIQQLRGLAERQDEEAFLPLRREEFAPEIPRRLRGLRRLVDDATDRARAKGLLDTEKLNVTSKPWGYGRYVRIAGQTAWFGVHVHLWARRGSTPLWLWFWDDGLDVLESLHGTTPPKPGKHDRFVPTYLPVGEEREAVLDAIVERLAEVADRISPEPQPPASE